MSKLVLYIFYKNIFMSICMHWFGYYQGFSAQKIFPEAGIQLYNLIFTSIPILLLGIYDMDVSKKCWKIYPQLYTPCIENYFFTSKVFWRWVMDGIIEALFLSFMAPAILENSQPGSGTFNSYLESGALTFTGVIVVVNVKIIFLQCRWMWVHVLMLILSIMSWWGIAYIWSTYFYSYDPDWYKIWNYLMTNGSFWMGLWVMVTAIFCKDLYLSFVERDINPKPHHIVQELKVNPALRSSPSSVAKEIELIPLHPV